MSLILLAVLKIIEVIIYMYKICKLNSKNMYWTKTGIRKKKENTTTLPNCC